MSSTPPSQSALEGILSRFETVRVTVFGDFCLDAYWWIDDDSAAEKSLETGLPPRHVRRQQYSLGGAGNVIANLIDLGVRNVKAVGVVGADLYGEELQRLLERHGVDTSGMITLKDGWQTFVYAKPYRGEKEDNRLDFGSFNTLSQEATDALLENLSRAAGSSDVVVLNQQVAAGISTPEVITRINDVIKDHPGTRFIVDARHRADLYRGAMLKVNIGEAARLMGETTSNGFGSADEAKTLARRISQKTGHTVFLTRGKSGLLVADQDLVHEIPGIQIIERTDPVGAGDTVAAALSAVVGSGGDAIEAAKFANLAASITVRKIQTTGTVTPEEILRFGREPDYVYRPELAEDMRLARFIEGTGIEIVCPPTPAAGGGVAAGIKHAIFDHDGTISTLREGWEQIMEPMMVKAVLGSGFASAETSVYRKVKDAVGEFIDKTTGIQTLVQMQGLVQMVRQFGFVPPEQILDEHGYKQVYNEELLKMVRDRVKKLSRGELDSSDFQIKNAARLLEELHRRGVKLYLASGTDERDVRAEAETLGYAHLFEGRIFGAVGDVKIEAKRIVLERIIREHSLSGHEFVTFGDGPVEIRETERRGGICVGVASDEVRRFGLNPAKRTRLIRAGAQIIVPDFSQLKALLALLGLE